MADHESLRNSILQDSDLLGSKRRFGLFSQPISTAVGDDGAFRNKIHPRNEQGKPITQLRNIYVSPNKSGQLRASSFGPLNSLASHERKDIFMEEGIRIMKEQYQYFNKGKKQTSFFPIAGTKTITNSAYKFMEQHNPQMNPKRFRNEDGRVKSSPRNCVTNPQSKIIHQSFKPIKYIQDPFERNHEQELKDIKMKKEKQQEVNFKPNHFVPECFDKSKKVYGLDKEIIKTSPHQISYHLYQHENPWKPSNPIKESFMGLFQPVPKYIENPPPQKIIKNNAKSEKDPFYGMNASSLSKPSPSVSLNRVNIMRNIGHSFSPKR